MPQNPYLVSTIISGLIWAAYVWQLMSVAMPQLSLLFSFMGAPVTSEPGRLR